MVRGGQLTQKFERPPFKHRVAPTGRNVEEGKKNEPAFVQPRMRQRQSARPKDALAMRQQIKIDGPRPPATTATAAEGTFHVQQFAEERSWRQGDAQLRDRVHVIGLPGPADRGCAVKTRQAYHPHAGTPRERANRAVQLNARPPEVRTKGDVRREFSFRRHPLIIIKGSAPAAPTERKRSSVGRFAKFSLT